MQLKNIRKMTGTLELITGLHIGGGDAEMRIGGIDNQVVRNPISDDPYIPGSSLKGKMRNLLEWHFGLVKHNGSVFSDYKTKEPNAQNLLKLFGGAPDNSDEATFIGSTRLAFWDCNLNETFKNEISKRNLLATESKSENTINRISGVASNPRHTERVIAGAKFDFTLTFKVLENDNEQAFLDTILLGLKLLELDSLGGSGSRGYGKVKFANLKLAETDVQPQLDALQPFKQTA